MLDVNYIENFGKKLQEETEQKLQLLDQVDVLKAENVKLKEYIKKVAEFEKEIISSDEAWNKTLEGLFISRTLINKWMGITAERNQILEVCNSGNREVKSRVI
jgi:uncharacterized protein Yka (UPF0111/DUF47 family)